MGAGLCMLFAYDALSAQLVVGLLDCARAVRVVMLRMRVLVEVCKHRQQGHKPLQSVRFGAPR
jgi:hypothetical protein